MKLQFNLHKKYMNFYYFYTAGRAMMKRLIDGLNLVMRFTSTTYDIVVHLYSVTP